MISAAGRDRSASRSQSTPAGGWNAPTRFLPSSVLSPVLPPTAASTMPSSVVGTCTTRTPRSQAAATNPARSVAAPPPSATTASDRVKARRPSSDQRLPATSSVLARSPSGTAASTTSRPAPVSARSTSTARSASACWCTTSTCRASVPTSAGSSPSSPLPTTTSYGAGPPTVMRVGSLTDPPPGRSPRRPLGRPAVGLHRHGGDLLVDRSPLLHQPDPLGARVAQQQRPVAVEADPRRRVLDADVEEDDGAPGQPLPRPGVEHCPAADRQDPVVLLQCDGDGGALELAEVLLAVLDEEVADAAASDGFDVGIGVPRGDADPRRERGGGGGLARPRRSDQHDDRRHHRTVRAAR